MCKRLVFFLCLGLGVVGFTAGDAFGLTFDIRIATAMDDNEEVLSDGSIDDGSGDIEIPYEDVGGNKQIAGLRFQVPIPKGAVVKKAYLEFECDEEKNGTDPVNVLIEGQLIPNAPAMTTTTKDITNRTPWTTAKVKCAFPTWTAADQKVQLADISAILNEIINQAGWVSGNYILLTVQDDASNPSKGTRGAESYDGESTAAALLHIEVSSPFASVPNPADGATGVTQPLLGWTGGDGAIFHNVYLGTSPTLTEANLVAKNQPFPMYFHVPGIDPGVTYYWRVDEVDAAGKVSAGAVWSFSTPSPKAYSPFPLNSGKYAPTDVTLTWTAGYGAVFHTVYFGTSLADVNNASGGKGQAATTYTPAGPLAKGTTYYWRVDEVGAPPASPVVKGSVWSFTTMADIAIGDPALVGWWTFDEGTGTKAFDFSGHGNDGTFGGGVTRVPGILGSAIQLANGYVVIDGVVDDVKSTNLTLSAWIKTTQGSEGEVFGLNDSGGAHPLLFGISGGTIYTNDNGDTDTMFPPAVNDNQWHMITFVRNGGTAIIYRDGVQIGTYASTFSLSTVTLWSIAMEWDPPSASDFYNGLVDDVRVYNKALTASEVKDLMRGDPLLAWKPGPDTGSTVDVVKAERGLTWSAGDNAKQHDIYFGTDEAAVKNADASDKTGVYRGRQAQASFTPAEPLGWGTGPYYWRVDEVQDNGTISPGAVWSFSVANFLIVDDMESYTDEEGSRIYETWVDGWTNNTGAVVGNLTAPFAERTIVHGGLQAMPMDFNNAKTPFYSEAEQTFSPLQDWTSNGVDTLSLWVHGNPIGFVDKGNGAFTVGASGHDIWDNADDFRFIYKRLSGNGSIMVKVESLTNTNVWAKAGVMIRDSLDAGSPMVYMIESFSSGVSFGWRQNMGLACGSATQAGIVAPQWVKLTRTGNAFTAQYSADGKTWTDIKDATTGAVVSTTIGMGANVYIGLCVTSHDTAATTTAELSGAATTGGVTGSWQQAWIGDDPDRTNGAGNFYVAVEDSAGKVAVASDPALVNAGVWTEWKIPLSSFAGVNLAKVKKLYIGVGDRKNPAAGGAGRMYIDDIRLTKPPAAVSGPLDLRIAAGTDDAEEHLNAGMDLTSSDLEIIDEDPPAPATDEQLIGMRWLVPVAKGSAMKKAYIEFQLKEIASAAVNTAPVNVIIEGQLAANPVAFTTTAKDITNRPRTTAQVKWTIPTGMAVGDKFQTPDISSVIKEIVNQAGWASGNALVIILRDDKSSPSTGIRCTWSYNGNAAAAPLLHIE